MNKTSCSLYCVLHAVCYLFNFYWSFGIHNLLEFQMDPVLFQTKTGWDFVYANIFTKSVLKGRFFGVFVVFNGSEKGTLTRNGLTYVFYYWTKCITKQDFSWTTCSFIRPKCENNMTFALLFGQYMRIYIEQVQGCFSPCTGYYCVVTYIHLICINTESNVERNTWGNFWVWINTEAYLGIFEKSLMQKAVNYFQRNSQPWMLNKVINTFMYHSFSIVVTRCHSFYLVVI